MARDLTERYQLAGFDACERGFNRPVDFEHVGDGYRAVFRYEAEFLATDEKATREAALAELVRMLQARGYSQLRSQVSFKNGAYLGSQQPWVEHPDRTGGSEHTAGPFGLFGWLRRRFNPRLGDRW